ncbi:MAG: site-specific DNA-methyltransferase, partial [Lysobacter sp.]|nr:site-specific DNA-methyltransferase [Lysobacter sp.]
MHKSLLEMLPAIVAEGRQQAAGILAGLETPQRARLQTRECVSGAAAASPDAGLIAGGEAGWHNRLIHGDN